MVRETKKPELAGQKVSILNGGSLSTTDSCGDIIPETVERIGPYYHSNQPLSVIAT